MRRADKTLLLAEIESIYGTDPVPLKTANAFITTNLKVDPIFKKVPRLGINQAGGAYADLVVGEGVKISFDTELYPAASANAVPYIDPLLQACGFVKSGGTSTPVVYTHNLDNWSTVKSVTIYAYLDQIAHQILGCVGTMKLNAVTNEIVKLSFEFTGLYSTPVAGSIPLDSTFPTSSPLMAKSAAMQFDSITMVGTTLDIDLGNTISPRTNWNNANGISGYYISAMAPTVTIDPEADAPDSLDYYSCIQSANPGAFTYTLDGGARDVVITSENMVMDSASDASRNNIMTKNITLVPKAVLNDATYAPLVLTFS